MRLCEKTKRKKSKISSSSNSNISCCLLVLRYINTYSYLATYLTSSSTPLRTYCSISFVLILFEVISFDVLNICFLSICIISSPRSFVQRVEQARYLYDQKQMRPRDTDVTLRGAGGAGWHSQIVSYS